MYTFTARGGQQVQVQVLTETVWRRQRRRRRHKRCAAAPRPACTAPLPPLTHGPRLHKQLPDELLVGLRVDVAHVAGRLLVAVGGVDANQVGARRGGDAAARGRHGASCGLAAPLGSASERPGGPAALLLPPRGLGGRGGPAGASSRPYARRCSRGVCWGRLGALGGGVMAGQRSWGAASLRDGRGHQRSGLGAPAGDWRAPVGPCFLPGFFFKPTWFGQRLSPASGNCIGVWQSLAT